MSEEFVEKNNRPSDTKMLFWGALIGVVCVSCGAATAYFVAGPKIFQPRTEQIEVAQDSAESHQDTSKSHHASGHGAKTKTEKSRKHHAAHGDSDTTPSYRIDGLIVNPANTRGTRYLLVSLDIRVSSEAEVGQIEAHETALRHAIIRLLGGKTVGFLADVSNWDTLANELKQVIESTVPDVSVLQVVFPEYVIQ